MARKEGKGQLAPSAAVPAAPAAAHTIAPEARVIVEAALRDEMASTKWNVMGRRHKHRETHFLLRATGMGWRRAWHLRRGIVKAATRLRQDGMPTEREVQLAVDLLLQS